jgi:hypothetical protein
MQSRLKHANQSRRQSLVVSGRSQIVLAGSANDRRGSVLLVVIGLLGMLLLLGIAFYSFASQEQSSSQYYAEAAKVDNAGLSADALFEFALEQLIVGTSDSDKKQSALWGRRNALLAGVLGRSATPAFYDGFDLTPYNGTGLHLGYHPNGAPFVDLDYDGVPDADQSQLSFNNSPAATGVSNPVIPTLPALDVDFTTADLNSLPLAFIGRGVDQNGADVKVIIPSFHRPQLLRDLSTGQPLNWAQNSLTATRVMRPHPNHVYIYNGTGNPRFLSATATNVLGETVQPFPFGSNATLKQGVWDLTGPPAALPVTSPTYQWDADPDGDGIKEGIWMDLDFPVQTLSDGRKYVPLFSFTVVDADGLINLNIAGNQSGLVLPSGGTFALGNGLQLSRSNMGLSRSEISPAWAMLADPNTDGASTEQHSLFWNTVPGAASFSRMEMANAETLFLNIGRPDFTTTGSGSYNLLSPAGGTYEPTTYFPGRYDELELMARNQYTNDGKGMAGYGDGNASTRNFSYLPKPGRSGQMFGAVYGDDDNDDSTPNSLPSSTYWDHVGQSRTDNHGYFYMGASFLSMRSGLAIPSFVHPLDFWGEGVSLQAVSGAPGVKMALNNGGLTMAVSGATVPGQWAYYSYGYSTPGVDTTGANFQNYLNAANGALLPQTHGSQIDEPDEIVVEWEIADSNSAMLQDEIFGPEVMLELQGTDADLRTTLTQGRVRDLAPFNFKLSQSAEAIRHQFTVVSHDRKNFGLGGMGPNSTYRTWEFNADADSDGNFEFPPQFVGVAGTTASEPFRQVMRQLLYVENNQTTSITNLAQLRLNLNKLLVNFDTLSGPVGAPLYRDLTPHPLVLPNTPITTSPGWNADSPSGATPSVNDQEYWARVDRQRMARDLYVLLYTLGGGNDGTNYTSDNSVVPMSNPAVRPIYNDAQLKEIAQFSVNVVDALDRDEVITKFEYDKNLHDGWNLDDYPYNGFSDPENSNADRGVVYGVESLKLTFSEVMGIISRQVKDSMGNGSDHKATQINDSAGDRHYTYIELRNTSPFNIDLSNGEWQIAVQNDNGADTVPNSGDETDIVQLTLISGNATSIINAGDLFTIGNRGGPAAADPANPTFNLPSLFKVDATGAVTPDFTAANPASWIVTSPTIPLSLDLIPQMSGALNNTALFLLTDGTGSGPGGVPGTGADVTTAGNFLYGGAGGNVTPAQESIGNPEIFILRRRAHPTRAKPVTYSSNMINNRDQQIDNPWIEVDRMSLSAWHEFKLVTADMAPEVQTKLLPLTSFERAQPFSRGLTGAEASHAPAAAAPYQAHSIGVTNSNSPGSFTQVQLHFDRDFASVVDLMSVPLYGPDDVTRRVGHAATFDNSDTTSLLAQERFMRPQHHDNMAVTLPSTALAAPQVALDKDNRWYRLFEFVEVPTQSEFGLRSYPYALRTSGAVNLNTVRHRGVLAGVIDDQDNPNTPLIEGHLSPNFANLGGEGAMLVDQFESGGPTRRDWWAQFLRSRDGIEPLTQLILPGTPAARPFRALGFMEHSIPAPMTDTPRDTLMRMPIEDTILRSLPIDVDLANAAAAPASYAQIADRRGLFEARAVNDRPSFSGSPIEAIDPYTKNRLLRKVVNNTTTRSNVFSVWITTRYFEAIETPTGTPNVKDIQIGDVLQGAQDHRGFFVIDRSLPEQAFSQNLGKFDFRKFIQYRKTIQ